MKALGLSGSIAAAFGAVMFASLLVPAHAQEAAAPAEVSESHIAAARAALDAINATDPYDGILPASAAALKRQLIEQNPNLEDLISQTVDEQALVLAGRRGDLEREAALVYARAMSEEHLNEIAAFYNTEAGKQLLVQGPAAARQVDQAAAIWQRGITRDLAQAVGESLAKSAPASQPPADAQPEQAAPAQ